MKTFDAIFIGFGKGGKTLAAEMARRGMKVAMIERSEKMYGGTCINIGCIPSKALIHQAEIADFDHPGTFEKKKDFYRNAIRIKAELVDKLRRKNFNDLDRDPNITIYTGVGSFISPEVVRVEIAGKRAVRLTADYFFINTGAEPLSPVIAGVGGNPFVYDSTSIMALETLPRRLAIIGGGYIGLEFASMFAAFGSKVTVLETSRRLLENEDEDMAQAVQTMLENKGILFHVDIETTAVTAAGNEAVLSYRTAEDQEKTLIADAVLIATGRKPNSRDIQPEAAGIELDGRGAIIVDSHMKTSNPKVFAIGDVTGGAQFTYISLDDYRVIRNYLFGESPHSTVDRGPPIYAMFLDPPLAHTGMHEKEAREAGRDIRVNIIPVSAIPRAVTLQKTEGLLKAVIDENSDEILGCTLFCPEASEIIAIVAIAIRNGLPSTFLRDFIFPHPTFCETFNELFR